MRPFLPQRRSVHRGRDEYRAVGLARAATCVRPRRSVENG